MKFTLLFVVPFLQIVYASVKNDDRRHTPRNESVEVEILRSFKSMYSHLAYVSHEFAERANDMYEINRADQDALEKIKELSDENCYFLGLVNRDEVPYLGSSLSLDARFNETEEQTFRDLTRVNSDITRALKNLKLIVKECKKYFKYKTGRMPLEVVMKEYNRVYNQIHGDFLIIFFKIAKTLYDRCKINGSLVMKEEIYAKEIFVDGLKSQMEKQLLTAEDQFKLKKLHTTLFIPNTDLLDNMFSDINKKLSPLPELKTLISLFNEYKYFLSSV